MKKISLLITSSMIMFACLGEHFGVIKVFKDDYKNTNTLRLELFSVTSTTEFGAKGLFATFTKTTSESFQETIKFYLSSQFSNQEQPLARIIYFKIDDKKIKVNLDSTKIIPNSSRNSSWSYHSGEFILSKELQVVLLNGNSLSVRFYSGDIPFDADFSSGDLQIIKELIKRKL